ncbi:MAG: SMC-Scp complex subunit ScpB [Mycoplasmoidaceae bacterium]
MVNNKKKIIEGLLFLAGNDGMTLDELILKSRINENTLFSIINEIIQSYIDNPNSALMLKKFGTKYKLITKPEIVDLLNLDNVIHKNPLNKSLLEILAIIAYNTPCTRTRIYEIRGKDPTENIKKLIEIGFVSDLGRSDSQGKPFIYGVTDLFYDTFGISSLSDLPEIILSDNSENDIDFFDINREDNE